MMRSTRVGGSRREASARVREKRKSLVPWSRGPTILLVEDDNEMREVLATALRRDGYRVIEAEDGDDALDFLGEEISEGEPARLPNLIVSEIRLPQTSGLDVLEGTRRVSRHVPVILMTGFGDEETHARARELGALRVLDKPFALLDFLAAVNDALRAPLRRAPWERDGHVT